MGTTMTQQVDDFVDQETDDDFAELDQLLNPKPQPDADDAEEGIDELEDLLAGAMEERKIAQQVKDARAKAKSGFQLGKDDLERIRRWELEREWLPVANTVFFRRSECACGFHSTVFEALMLEQRHRHSQFANRWTKAETSQAELPNKSVIRREYVPMCQRCCTGKGFQLAGAQQWEV